MKVKLYSLLIVVCALTRGIGSSKILCIYPGPTKSHILVFQTITKELAARGHDVTVINTYPLDNPPPNYRDIAVPLDSKVLELRSNMLKSKEGGGSKFAFIQEMIMRIKTPIGLANTSLHLPEVQKIMNEESFDLLVVGMFRNDFLIGLGAHFKCPIVAVSVNRETSSLSQYMGNPMSTSFIPHLLMEASGLMTFKQRTINMLLGITESLVMIYADHLLQLAYSANFPAPKYPPFDEMKKNISLALVNYHFSQGLVRPLVPGIIDIGGIQAKQSPDPLPADIEQWISSAKDGAIFFSMGSNIQSKNFPVHKRDAILKTFSKLKQHVVWKFEDDAISELPKNVKVWKWLPQDDILAHPNIKLFITHGGAGSIAEAKFHGVPIIGIPIFADQPVNVGAVEADGWGIAVHYDNLTEAILSTAVNKILTDSSYTTIVKTASKIYRDRPMSSLETAVFWVEYVLRHRGAPHMQANSVHLNFLQLHSVDVLAVLFAFSVALLLINLFILRAVLRCISRIIFKKKPKKD